MNEKRFYTATVFQFSILGILSTALFLGYAEPDIIIGALIGLLVGIHLEDLQ